MNPTSLSSNSSNSLFQNSFENQLERERSEAAEPAEPIGETVSHSEEDKLSIKNSWAEFYSLKTEDIQVKTIETPTERIEITETKTEFKFTEPVKQAELQELLVDSKPDFIVEEQKGSGSWIEDAGLKLDFKGLFGALGGLGKSLFGAMSLFKEIAMDTTTLMVGKKEKKTKKQETDPAKIKAAEKKKAQAQVKQNFYTALQAQSGSVVSTEAVRFDAQEKENINKTIKLTNVSYKGIKDSFGRLTVYAASMFEREQTEQEKQYKKMEKQQKAASTGPDLNLDKAAEGGFLSTTGGQGAG